MEYITLKLTDELHITVKGIYEKGTPAILYPVDEAEPGIPDYFDILNIEIIKGNVYDFAIWIDENSIHEIEEKCLDKFK